MLRAFTFLITCSLNAVCQQPRGSVSGTVSDLFGDPLTGVVVEVLSDSQRVIRSARTDVAGGYRIGDMPAGHLDLLFQLQGFQQERCRIQLQDGETLYFHIGLQPGALTDLPAIEVSGSVLDLARRPIRSVRVSVTAHLNPRLTTETLTDSSGRYRAFLQTPGVYIISIHARKMSQSVIILAPAPAITPKPPIRADFVLW
jgi:Carboxypeptidase regulatory-like domain